MERREDGEVVVRMTAHEARALRLACIFGTPTPTPPEIDSALDKLRAGKPADRTVYIGVNDERAWTLEHEGDYEKGDRLLAVSLAGGVRDLGVAEE